MKTLINPKGIGIGLFISFFYHLLDFSQVIISSIKSGETCYYYKKRISSVKVITYLFDKINDENLTDFQFEQSGTSGVCWRLKKENESIEPLKYKEPHYCNADLIA